MTTYKSPFLAKCATPDMAEIIAKAGRIRPTWLLDVRTVLRLPQHEMAELLATPLRTYQRWESNPEGMSIEAYRRAEALLDVANLDSRGRIKVAG
jgi:DNA-binding transcriptional regulator YiaG